MSSIQQDHSPIRRFLLQQVDDLEREQLETKLFVDLDYKDEVLIVEEELIEDYLNDSLPADDRLRFESHYLATPQQAQKFMMAKALHRYCSIEEAAHSPPTPEEPEPSPEPKPWPAKRPASRKIFYALAATVLLAVLVGLWVFVVRPRQPVERLRAELHRINTPGGISLPGRAVILTPVTLRGSEVQEVSKTGPEIVELLLVLPTDNHQNYRVAVRRVGEAELYALEHVGAGLSQGGRAISFKVPAHLMTPGDYTLEVSGLAPDGKVEGIADFSFRVN